MAIDLTLRRDKSQELTYDEMDDNLANLKTAIEELPSLVWGNITGTLSNQTDLQTALNGKSSTTHTHSDGTQSVAGFISTVDKTKLDGIATGATNYAHPTGDGNLHVPATSTTNNGKVLTAGATAGSLSWQTPLSGVAIKSYENLFISSGEANIPQNLRVSFSEIVLSDENNNYFRVKDSDFLINTGSTGLNGLDTGTFATNTWYSIWVISNSTTSGAILSKMESISATITSTSAVITGITDTSSLYKGAPVWSSSFLVGTKIKSIDSSTQVTVTRPALTSGTACTFVSLPSVPTGYDYKLRVGSTRTASGSAYPLCFVQRNNCVQYVVDSSRVLTALPIMSSGAQGDVSTPTFVAVDTSNFVSPAALEIRGTLGGTGTANSMVAPNNSYGAYNSSTNPPPVVVYGGQNVIPFSLELESIYLYWANSASGPLLRVLGWIEDI